MKRSLRRLSSQQGQGTLEYVLVLTIVVIIFLSVVWRFNSSFRAYSDQFFDGYIACLLETGELPGNGGACGAEFVAFDSSKEFGPGVGGGTIELGPGGAGSGPGSGGGGGSGSSGSSTSGSGSGSGDGKDGSGSNTAGSGSGNGRGSGSSSDSETASSEGLAGPSSGSDRQAVGSMRRSRGKASTPEGKASGSKEESAFAGKDALVGVGPSGNFSSNSNATLRARRTALDRGYGFFGQEEEADRETERPPIAQVTKDSEGEESLRPKKAVETGSRGPASKSKDDDRGLELGALVRFILIGLIFVAIIYFFGNQIAAISRSGEK